MLEKFKLKGDKETGMEKEKKNTMKTLNKSPLV